MSYGKWKALHYKAPVIVPEVKVEVKRPCKMCGGEIPVWIHKNALYCGAECVRQAERDTAKRCYWRKKERMMKDGKI